MKSTLLPGSFILLFSCFIMLLPFLAVGQTAEMKEIAAIKLTNEQWLNCYPKRDSATLGKILANDFVMTAPNGFGQTRKEVLSGMLSPNMETISVHVDSVNARLLSPEVGLLNAWTTFVFKYNGSQTVGKTCYLDVYMKRKGRWVAVAAHVTSLNAQ